LDRFVVFTKSGIVLWRKSFVSIRGDPVCDFIKSVLLEERNMKDGKFMTELYTIRWALHNELDLVFVVIYPKEIQVEYLNTLPEKVRSKFVERFGDNLKHNKSGNYFDMEEFEFDAEFEDLRIQCESEFAEKKIKVQKVFEQTSKGKDKEKREKEREAKDGLSKKKEREKEKEKQRLEEEQRAEEERQKEKQLLENKEESLEAKMKQIMAKQKKSKGGAPRPFKKESKNPTEPKTKPNKQKRIWDDDPNTTPTKLNFVDHTDQIDLNKMAEEFGAGEETKVDDWSSMIKKREEEDEDEDEDDNDVNGDTQNEAKKDTKPKNTNEKDTKRTSGWLGLGSLWQGLTNRVLTAKDLEPVLSKFKDILIEKNVAAEIAEELCHTVGANLEGKTMSSFTRIRSSVHTALEEALTRILTPKKNLNIVAEARRIRQKENRPYTIVFVGVNGVGKSTNLAKVCNYLLQEKLSVLVCACDTFRAGAVEQLKTHTRCLKVDLHEQGYIKDPAIVAQNGIAKAKREGKDVVLIDTAGRMQNKTPLMIALAKLVYHNQPDLILFVGEALVGNEAVDQLTQFNRALEEHAPNNVTHTRSIDGIILTKFDTVDKKVGAAISMAHITGQPIVFVGTGQKYPDLKRMHAAPIVAALLS